MAILRALKSLSPTRARKLRKERKAQREKVERAAEIIRERVAPGQRGLFIDCGFNTRTVFDRYYERLGDDFDFVGFEIQPVLYERAVSEQPKYRRGSVEFIHAAISDRDGSIRYFEPRSWGLNYKGGATIVPEKNDRPSDEVEHEVRCIDFSTFLAERAAGYPLRVVKMDVEGAEYPVLEKLIADGRLELIDLLFVEFHHQYLSDTDGTDWAGRHDAVVRALERSNTEHFDWI